MERDTATGLRFALSATAEPCDDDRPCAFCNPDESVEERRYAAEERLDDIEAGDEPYPKTTVVTYTRRGEEVTASIVSDRKVIGGGIQYKVELQDKPNTYQYLSHDDIEEATIPGDVGVVKADYILRFGHEDGEGVEVPACDSCLVDVPVAVRGESATSEMQYHYYGDGEVRQKFREYDDENDMWHHKTEKVEVDS